MTSQLVRILRDRNYSEPLNADNLNVLFDRNSVKAAETLASLLERGTLSAVEEERFRELEAAGVIEEDTFEGEKMIIEFLEKSIKNLQSVSFENIIAENSIETVDFDFDIDPQLGCNVDVVVEECINSVCSNVKSIIDQLADEKKRHLPGYHYETLQDWQCFTLQTMEEIESVWRQYEEGVNSDYKVIESMRNEFLNQTCAVLLERVEQLEKILSLMQYCNSYILDSVENNSRLFKELEHLMNQTCVRSTGVDLECHSDVIDTEYNLDLAPSKMTLQDYKTTQLPMFKLKNALHRAQEESAKVARIIKAMHDSVK